MQYKRLVLLFFKFSKKKQPETPVRNHNLLLPADFVGAELVHDCGKEERDEEPAVGDKLSLYIAMLVLQCLYCLLCNVKTPDYCADNDCGEDEFPVQLVLVGEDAHPQEEEDDAVTEKTNDDIESDPSAASYLDLAMVLVAWLTVT